MTTEHIAEEAVKCADRLAKAFIMPAQELTFRTSVEAGFCAGAAFAQPKWMEYPANKPEDGTKGDIYVKRDDGFTTRWTDCIYQYGAWCREDPFDGELGLCENECWTVTHWQPLPTAPEGK